MLFDTHSHLNFKAFYKDRTEVIEKTLKEGVFMLNVGSNYETSELAVRIAEEHEGAWAAIALHPIHVKDEIFDYKKYKELAQSSKKVVAIGETGLDAMYPHPSQEKIFLEHLKLAKELDLPIILHCRKAHAELLKLLKAGKGVLHCFTGRWKEAQEYLALGFYLGFNGIIFKMDLDEVIRKTPLERMLIETDCPYLTPPQEGEKRNEPLFVKHVAEKIAEIKGVSFDEVAETTFHNAKTLFLN